MNIFVFQKPNGGYGADFSREFASRSGHIVDEIPVSKRKQIDAVLENPGKLNPARVYALAERALAELQDLANPIDAPPPQEVRERNFWRRLRWLFTGK